MTVQERTQPTEYLTLKEAAARFKVSDTGEEAFQTVAERRAGMKGGFQLAVGLGHSGTASIPAESMRTVMASPTATIAWRPTLIPFDVELPVTCDWVRGLADEIR